MKFEIALEAVRQGKKISRESWPVYDYIEADKDNFFITRLRDGSKWNVKFDPTYRPIEWRRKWNPTYQDILAEDWYTVDGSKLMQIQPKIVNAHLTSIIEHNLPYHLALGRLIKALESGEPPMVGISRKDWEFPSQFVFISSTGLIGSFLMKREGDLKYDIYVPTNKDQFANDWTIAEMVEDDV